MRAVPRTRTRTVQPQTLVGANPAQLSTKLVLAASVNGEAVWKNRPLFATGVTKQATQVGEAYDFSGSQLAVDCSFLGRPQDALSGANALTVVARFKCDTLATEQTILSSSDTGQNNFLLVVRTNGALGFGPAFDGSNAFYRQTGASVIQAGVWYTVVCTWSAAENEVRAWINGVPQGALGDLFTVGTVTRMATNSNPIVIGLRSNNLNKMTGQIAVVGIFTRRVFTSEALSLSANPWQMFEPLTERVFFGVSGPTYTLTTVKGNFSLTGVASSLLAARLLTANAASFTLTGQSTGLRYNRVLAAEVGSFTLDGKSANLLFNRTLVTSTGEFVLTGNVANLVYTPTGVTYTLTAETGNFDLTGQLASLLANRVLTAQLGEFALTGNDAGLYLVVPGTGPVLYLDLISKKVMLLQRLD